MSIILIAVYWIVYFIVHSLLASDTVKSIVYNSIKISERTYRLIYVLISIIGFLAILLVLAIHEHHYIFHNSLARFFGLVLATYGIFILREAFRHYHTRAFLGLADPAQESEKLVKEGLQKHIRHPLYAGTILLLVGFLVYMPSWANLISVVISIIYILIGIQLEEKKLIKTFGEEYREYRKNVPMLIPKLKR